MENSVIENIVIHGLKKVIDIDKEDNNFILFGDKEAILDSLDLVRLITIIEEEIFNVMSIRIIIVSDKAMSQKQSPFNTIESLTDFIEELINEK